MPRFNVYAAVDRSDDLDRVGCPEARFDTPEEAIADAWEIEPGERLLVIDLDGHRGYAYKVKGTPDNPKLKRVLAA